MGPQKILIIIIIITIMQQTTLWRKSKVGPYCHVVLSVIHSDVVRIRADLAVAFRTPIVVLRSRTSLSLVAVFAASRIVGHSFVVLSNNNNSNINTNTAAIFLRPTRTTSSIRPISRTSSSRIHSRVHSSTDLCRTSSNSLLPPVEASRRNRNTAASATPSTQPASTQTPATVMHSRLCPATHLVRLRQAAWPKIHSSRARQTRSIVLIDDLSRRNNNNGHNSNFPIILTAFSA